MHATRQLLLKSVMRQLRPCNSFGKFTRQHSRDAQIKPVGRESTYVLVIHAREACLKVMLAALQEAQRLIEEAHKAAGKDWRGPAVDKDLAHTVEYYQGSIADAIEKANTDNARIYFQRVPSSVPAVQPAVMVNSAAPTGVTPSFRVQTLEL